MVAVWPAGSLSVIVTWSGSVSWPVGVTVGADAPVPPTVTGGFAGSRTAGAVTLFWACGLGAAGVGVGVGAGGGVDCCGCGWGCGCGWVVVPPPVPVSA